MNDLYEIDNKHYMESYINGDYEVSRIFPNECNDDDDDDGGDGCGTEEYSSIYYLGNIPIKIDTPFLDILKLNKEQMLNR